MKVTFHGATQEVTGSCHLVETDHGRVLLDCGLIQGGKERHERNREPFPFDPQGVDCVVLSHAHVDHCARLPLLHQRGYRGPIFCTNATARLAKILLVDSGHIQEEDARWKIIRLECKGKDASWVRPLYTQEDALAVTELFEPVPFDAWTEIGELGHARFNMAGHILGAGIVELRLQDAGRERRLTFSGDLGVQGSRLLSAPAAVQTPEVLLVESTYGDRRRQEEDDRTELLFRLVERTVDAGGKLVIPSFAVGRTQELLARFNDLVESGRIRGVPVYVDSPMAVQATKVFTMFPEAYSEEARRLYCSGDKPLEFDGLRLVSSVDESKTLNASRESCVIISASGMCTAGRIKHHLKHNISDPNSTILFVGYQAQRTLGRLILEGTDPIRIFREWYPVRARIERIHGFSAHADLDELLAWYASLGGVPARTFVVHGDADVAATFGNTLRLRFGGEVDVPALGDSFTIE